MNTRIVDKKYSIIDENTPVPTYRFIIDNEETHKSMVIPIDASVFAEDVELEKLFNIFNSIIETYKKVME